MFISKLSSSGSHPPATAAQAGVSIHSAVSPLEVSRPFQETERIRTLLAGSRSAGGGVQNFQGPRDSGVLRAERTNGAGTLSAGPGSYPRRTPPPGVSCPIGDYYPLEAAAFTLHSRLQPRTSCRAHRYPGAAPPAAGPLGRRPGRLKRLSNGSRRGVYPLPSNRGRARARGGAEATWST